MIGLTFDRYRVEAELGSGGMATVYRVRHVTLGSMHALKVLKLHGVSVRQRLVQEGRIQARLRHPNIVSVTDVIDVDGAPGLVMEFVGGPTLEGWLESHRPSLDQTEAIFRGILAGVDRAHRHGLVHRDLKPGNILLDVDSGRGIVPKVTDFGLAKVLAEDEDVGMRTQSGVAMGTPAYMASEQIRSARNVDGRADVFALGCILYEMVAGRRPFRGSDVVEIMNAVCQGNYPPIGPEVPERVRLTVEACLSVDRARRPADCATVRLLLWDEREHAGDGPPGIPPIPGDDSGAAPTGTFDFNRESVALEGPSADAHPRRSRAWAGIAVVLLGLGAAWLLVGARDTETEDPDPASATAAPPASPMPMLLGLVPLAPVGVSGGTADLLTIAIGRALEAHPEIRLLRLASTTADDDRLAAAAAVGHEEGLQYVLVGTVGTLGTRTMLNLERVVVDSGRVDARAYRLLEGGVDGLVDALPEILDEVLVAGSTGAAAGEITRTIKERNGDARRCVEAGLKTDPSLNGRVTLGWKILASGVVRDARVVSNTTGSTALGDCIRDVIAGALFPAGTEAEVAEFPYVVRTE